MRFGSLLKDFRFKAGIATLSDLSKQLQAKGFYYENSILSRWQTGSRTPKSRILLLTLVFIFIEHHAIDSTQEVNMLLESAGQGFITQTEKTLVLKQLLKTKQAKRLKN